MSTPFTLRSGLIWSMNSMVILLVVPLGRGEAWMADGHLLGAAATRLPLLISQIYWHKVFHNSPLLSLSLSTDSIVLLPVSALMLVTYLFSHFFPLDWSS